MGSKKRKLKGEAESRDSPDSEVVLLSCPDDCVGQPPKKKAKWPTMEEEILQQRIKQLEDQNKSYKEALWMSMLTKTPVRAAENLAPALGNLLTKSKKGDRESGRPLAVILGMLDVSSLAVCKKVCSRWRNKISKKRAKLSKRRFDSLSLSNEAVIWKRNMPSVPSALFNGKKFALPISSLHRHLELLEFDQLVFKPGFKLTNVLLRQLGKVIGAWGLRTLKFVGCHFDAVDTENLVKFFRVCSPSLDVLCFRALDDASAKKVTDEVVRAAGENLSELVVAMGAHGKPATHLTPLTDQVLKVIARPRLSNFKVVLDNCAVTSDGIAQLVEEWQQSEASLGREHRYRPYVTLMAVSCQSVALNDVVKGCRKRRLLFESSVRGEPPSLTAVSTRASLNIRLHGSIQADEDEAPEPESEDDDKSLLLTDDDGEDGSMEF